MVGGEGEKGLAVEEGGRERREWLYRREGGEWL